MQNKLYKMPMVWSVDGRKGVYTTTEPEEVLTNPEDFGSGFKIDMGVGDMPDEFLEDDLDDRIPF